MNKGKTLNVDVEATLSPAMKLAKMYLEIEDLEREKKIVQEDFKMRISAKKEEMRKLSEQVRDGQMSLRFTN